MADAIRTAVEMSSPERALRMTPMASLVYEHNVIGALACYSASSPAFRRLRGANLVGEVVT